jgi:hypothetical protein
MILNGLDFADMLNSEADALAEALLTGADPVTIAGVAIDFMRRTHVAMHHADARHGTFTEEG